MNCHARLLDKSCLDYSRKGQSHHSSSTISVESVSKTVDYFISEIISRTTRKMTVLLHGLFPIRHRTQNRLALGEQHETLSNFQHICHHKSGIFTVARRKGTRCIFNYLHGNQGHLGRNKKPLYFNYLPLY